MSYDEPLNTEGLLWEIGKCIVVFRYHAEAIWLDTETYDDRFPLQALERTLQELTDRLRHCAEIKPQCKFNALAEAANEFWTSFRTAWNGTSRGDKISLIGNIDPDQQGDADQYMHKDSPLQNGQWGKVESALAITLQTLTSEPELKACMKLSMLLLSDVHPTITNGERKDGYTIDTYRVRREVRQHMQPLVESFSFLAGLELTIVDPGPTGMIAAMLIFAEKIETLLLNPQDRRGYLGLIIQQHRQTVHRNGISISTGGKLQWKLLEFLEKSHDNPCTRELLGQAWGSEHLDAPDPRTLHRAISDLRKVLAPLRIDIKSTRGVGWTLVELPAVVPMQV